jgi:hypothetical protein
MNTVFVVTVLFVEPPAVPLALSSAGWLLQPAKASVTLNAITTTHGLRRNLIFASCHSWNLGRPNVSCTVLTAAAPLRRSRYRRRLSVRRLEVTKRDAR